MEKAFSFIALFCLSCLNMQAQNPSNYTFPNPTPNPNNLTANTYTRATQSINLKNGFSFNPAASQNGNNLLNLNINSYPNYVNNNYTNPADNQNYYSVNPNLEVGVTQGAHQVDNIGGFNYNIPIVCSPGRAGLEPNLSVVYNSNGGNGWLGLGFNLSGISAITRTGKTVLYDGLNSGINFNSNDVYALDGSRLFIKSGTYGQNGATYRTEVENYAVITSHGSQGSGAQYFTVTTPDGMTMEYGNNASAKSVDVNNTDVLAWYINKVYDVYGNYMEYFYTNSNGELLITKIEYTKHSSVNLYNKIEFNYIERSDNAPLYVAGKEFRNKHLLQSIVSKDINGNAVRKYFFEYQYQYGSLLNKVTEVDANGNQLNPTFFEWNDETLSWNWKFGAVSTATDIVRTTAADINGDGKQDLILTRDYGADHYVETKLNVGGSFSHISGLLLSASSASAEIFAIYVFDEDDDGIDEVFYIMGQPITTPNHYEWEIKKLKNTNGTLSIVQEEPLHTDTGAVVCWGGLFWNFQKSVTSGCFYAKQDVTGDNLNDVIMSDGFNIKLTPSNQQAAITLPVSNLVKIGLGDFNGDGVLDIYTVKFPSTPVSPSQSQLLDILVYSYNEANNTLNQIVSTQVNIGSNPYYTTWGAIGFAAANAANASKCIGFGDVNGDGKTDIFYVNYNNGTSTCKLIWLRSNGVAFMTAPQDEISLTTATTFNNLEANFSVADVNNDGKSDIMVSSFDTVYVGHASYSYFPSIGTALVNDNMPTAPVWGRRLSTMGDFDGDGAMDFVFQDDATDSYILYHGFDEDNKKMVKRIFNIRDEINITYNFLPSAANCQKTTPAYGNNNYANFKIIKPALYAVSSVVANGQTTSYGYSNGILHRQGRGFIGFERLFVRNEDKSSGAEKAGMYSGFEYNHINDAVTWSESMSTYLSNSNMFSINHAKTSSYSSSLPGFSYVNGSGYLRRLSSNQTISKNYLSSTHNLQTVTYDPNNAGSPLQTVFQNRTWLQFGILNSTQTDYVYQTIAVNGKTCYKPQQVTEQISAGSVSTFIHTYSYDGQGRLTTEVKNSNIAGQAVTTAYSNFNAFGAPQNISVSAPNVASRSSQVQYDNTGRFITKSTNAIGDFAEFVYEPGLGNKIQEKDASGLITNYKYDGLGRAIWVKLPNGAVNTVKYEWYPYNSLYGTKVTTQAENAPSTWKYYDRNGNMILAQQQDFGGNTKTANFTYNILNQPLTAQDMHYSSQSNYNSITYSYDDYMRPLTKTKSIVGQNTVINYSYNNLSNNSTYNKGFVQMSAPTATNGITYSVKRENNSAGQTDKVINTSNGTTHSASYNFNEFGQPTYISNDYAGAGQYGITMSYDALGRQSGLNDPNAGNCTYQYNAFGELTQQITPNGTYNMQYDLLGRVTQKTDGANNTYTYLYETSNSGKGQLKQITGANMTTEFKYDDFSRLTEKKETLTADNKVFKSNFTYNKYGQLVNYTYPSGFVTKNEYDNIGNLIKIKNGNTTIWQLNTMAAPGIVSNYKYNNGNLSNSIVYDNKLNLSEIHYGNLKTHWYDIEHKTNNLQTRTVFDNNYANQEIFKYDEFDRLTKVQYYNINTMYDKATMTYNQNGNFNQKSDCGDYVYGNSNAPYQLTAIQNPVTANISLNTLNVTYNTFRKVSQIVEADPNGTKQFDFVYGNDEQRVKMAYSVGGSTIYTRYYADGCDRQEDNVNNTYKEWTYIYAPTGLCAVYYSGTSLPPVGGGGGGLYYVAPDHLGSPVMLINSNGQIAEEYSFDAWGRRRNPQDWNDYVNTGFPPLGGAGGLLIRGYTMHEMLDEVGIINMNGRIYDPVLGRFLQPDNYVQSPDNLQNFNRYGYCLNNPLKYTDPSGEVIGVAEILAATIGGVMNVAANWDAIKNSKSSFGAGVAYFGIGAVSGVVGLYTFGAGGGALAALGNGLMQQQSGGQIVQNMVVGAVSGLTSYGIASGLGSINYGGITNNFARYAAKAGISFGVGFSSGFGGNLTGQALAWQFGWQDRINGKAVLTSGLTGGSIAMGISIGYSAYDYATWDRYDPTVQAEMLNKDGCNIEYMSKEKWDALSDDVKGGRNYKTTGGITTDGVSYITDYGLSNRQFANSVYYHETTHYNQIHDNPPGFISIRHDEQNAYLSQSSSFNNYTPTRYIKYTNNGYSGNGGRGLVYKSNFSNNLFNIFR
ncbi:MAG: VCBS repeat-containing protein [Bacteroidetes bacterium]|nr:VCBS repeat-containing protein [Bacteroidota bacterium]